MLYESGINEDNLIWMEKCANQERDRVSTFNGVLLLDGIAIQSDLQISKKGSDWQVIGACDLGELVNSLDFLSKKSTEIKLASHCFQYMFVSFGMFRWPVAYYGSHNVNGHGIYFTLWHLIDALSTHGFVVHGVLMDGSSNNRQFIRLVTSASVERPLRYFTHDAFDASHMLAIVQDIKHVFKKIRNSLYSSTLKSSSKRCLSLRGNNVVWEHFEGAYLYNCSMNNRMYRYLTKDHIYLNPQLKMRNRLAENVLNADMLNLMRYYRCTLPNPSSLDSTISVLEHTSVLIGIFLNTKSLMFDCNDSCVEDIHKVLKFKLRAPRI